jgi:hypothetical protein
MTCGAVDVIGRSSVSYSIGWGLGFWVRAVAPGEVLCEEGEVEMGGGSSVTVARLLVDPTACSGMCTVLV